MLSEPFARRPLSACCKPTAPSLLVTIPASSGRTYSQPGTGKRFERVGRRGRRLGLLLLRRDAVAQAPVFHFAALRLAGLELHAGSGIAVPEVGDVELVAPALDR